MQVELTKIEVRLVTRLLGVNAKMYRQLLDLECPDKRSRKAVDMVRKAEVSERALASVVSQINTE